LETNFISVIKIEQQVIWQLCSKLCSKTILQKINLKLKKLCGY